MDDKQFSPACERNKLHILNKLKIFLADKTSVLEIGSGTGQHAVHFGEHLPYLTWQTSDLIRNHDSILAWIIESKLTNVKYPLEFDVTENNLAKTYDAVFTANTLHIMSAVAVEHCIKQAGNVLNSNGLFIVYGPFNINGSYTSPSNKDFDATLKLQDPNMGIRDLEDIQSLCKSVNLKYVNKTIMPANNFLLIFEKIDIA